MKLTVNQKWRRTCRLQDCIMHMKIVESDVHIFQVEKSSPGDGRRSIEDLMFFMFVVYVSTVIM